MNPCNGALMRRSSGRIALTLIAPLCMAWVVGAAVSCPTRAATAEALTATPSPPGDLEVRGQVYDAALGPAAPIAGALVSALMCVPRTFHATTGSDGTYRLLPADYLNACSQLTFQVEAVGYAPLAREITVSELRAEPTLDAALTRLAARSIYLPLLKSGPATGE